jgi:glycosyltransferase involved in cell wall biosynthesis
LKTKYALPEKYIIAFGGGSRHKNIQRLLEAYENRVAIHDHSLVIIGRLPQGVVVPPPSVEGQRGPSVQCLGFVPTEHIQPLLSHAAVFALPTLYEGFGLPILEAQHAGVRVASSFAASLPEIGGEGAVYFDPTSVEAIGIALEQTLWLDAEKSEALRVAAQTNLSRFSWLDTAKSSVAVYRQVLGRE